MSFTCTSFPILELVRTTAEQYLDVLASLGTASLKAVSICNQMITLYYAP